MSFNWPSVLDMRNESFIFSQYFEGLPRFDKSSQSFKKSCVFLKKKYLILIIYLFYYL